MNFPTDLKYTKDHEWIRVDGNVAYVGITDYAQGELGEIVFVDITTEGEVVGKEEVFIAARVCYLHGYALDVFLSQELAREVVRRVSLARNVGDEVNLCLPLCEGRWAAGFPG